MIQVIDLQKCASEALTSCYGNFKIEVDNLYGFPWLFSMSVGPSVPGYWYPVAHKCTVSYLVGIFCGMGEHVLLSFFPSVLDTLYDR